MYIVDPFTWSRGTIQERLDRALCNEKWSENFPYAVVVHEHHTHSDHRPPLLVTDYYAATLSQKPKGERRFKAQWLNEDTVNEIVATAWQCTQLMGVGLSLSDRTRVVKAELF